MKKHFLYIMICGFALSLLCTGAVFSANTGQNASLISKTTSSLSTVEFPRDASALHASHWTNASGSWHRVQGGPAFLPYSEFKLAHALTAFNSDIAGANNFSFKDYLDHNYPSHNFW